MSSASSQKPLVSILTPAILPRLAMLVECRASVAAQTEDCYEHLVHVDRELRGCSWVMNRLAEQAQGEWLLPLADDDLLLPGGLRALLGSSARADIVYAPPLMWGWDSWHFYQEPPFIPSFALIRRSLWRELDGYDEQAKREEDRKLWVRAYEQGAVFVKVDYPCWVYRIHGGNKSLREGVAA